MAVIKFQWNIRIQFKLFPHISFRFTARDKEILKETITTGYDDWAVGCAVVAVVVVFALCSTIVVMHRRRWLCFDGVGQANYELGEDSPKKEIIQPTECTAIELNATDDASKTPEKDQQDLECSQNGTKSEGEAIPEPKNLSERIASFFRMTGKPNIDSNHDNVESGLNSSKCSANKTSNGTQDNTDATLEKKDTENCEIEEETASDTPVRFSRLLNLFKRSSQKPIEKTNEVDDNNQTNEADSEQAENKSEKQNAPSEEPVEFEPETKPSESLGTSNEIELEEGEGSPKLSSSPKNTAV